ncbi:MAG: biopolymer transporter ExbD [Maritimibacter sp.]
MKLAVHTRTRRPAEPILPMINVVFLLLVFFLLTARLAPPTPVEIDPPQAAGGAQEGVADTLYITADATIYFEGATGQDALDLLAQAEGEESLRLNVDRGLSGQELARFLAKIKTVTSRDLELTVTQ